MCDTDTQRHRQGGGDRWRFDIWENWAVNSERGGRRLKTLMSRFISVCVGFFTLVGGALWQLWDVKHDTPPLSFCGCGVFRVSRHFADAARLFAYL